LQIATIDFETYWSSEYSLTKLSPLEYVMGDPFELISCSIKVDDYPTDVFFGEPAIRKALHSLDWSGKGLCGHNLSGFDAYITAYRLGIRPRMYFCTLAMARPLHAKTTGLSLAKLVEHYGLGAKRNAVLLQTKGKRLADFTEQELRDMREYNRDDTEQCRGLFKKLLPHYSPNELWQIDALTRMRTEPAFELDRPLLETAASIERDRKHKAVIDLGRQLGVPWIHEDGTGRTAEEVEEDVRSQLASAPKFSALLEKLGVEVPTKPSPTNPEKEVPALAKTDEAFLALQEHDDPVVAAATRARLDVKSTLLETRIQKFLTAGRLAGGKLPVPLRYCGADTTGRDSGEEYNCQNLSRIDPDRPRPSDALRNSLRAPKGHKVIVADQSGIELRVNHFLWKVAASMALYQESPDKADLYRAFAGRYYNKAPEAISKPERQFGKICQLGLGFGAGAPAFQRVAKIMGGITLAAPESESAVLAWRSEYADIVQGWRACGHALTYIAAGSRSEVDPWGMVTTCQDGFVLPSGRLIRYPDLRVEEDGTWPDGRPRKSWFYAHGRYKARLTGPKATENIVQALARDSIFDCAVDFYKHTRLRPALRVHDELVYVVPEQEADALLTELQRIMRTPPRWWPELVVWSAGDAADSYGEAK